MSYFYFRQGLRCRSPLELLVLIFDHKSVNNHCTLVVVMDMLNVCVGPGELVFVVCGVCHLILIVFSYLYCAVVCHYMMSL